MFSLTEIILLNVNAQKAPLLPPTHTDFKSLKNDKKFTWKSKKFIRVKTYIVMATELMNVLSDLDSVNIFLIHFTELQQCWNLIFSNLVYLNLP